MYAVISRVVAIGALVVVLLAVASTAGPSTVWTNPAPGTSAPIEPSENSDSTLTPVPGDRSNSGRLTIPFLGETVTLVVTLLLVAMALFALREIGPSLTRRSKPVRRTRRSRGGRHRLAEVNPIEEHIDVNRARGFLVDKTPRNAIIRCWIQVQHDLASVGFSPIGSETPTEYVQRIEGEQMAETSPIANLAALYTEARFSKHELTETHRASAADALERISPKVKTPANSRL